jgi:putative RecB family exonuclease
LSQGPAYHRGMVLPLPTTLSPSKVSSFTDCALAFRFSAIDRLPEPPSVATTRGTLVHATLERLLDLPAPDRTPEAAEACLTTAVEAYREDPEWTGLEMGDEGEATMVAEAKDLIERYFRLEDPRTITPIGLEVMLEVEVGGVRLRGIIDRLELDADGELVVTDYKTGRAPSEQFEQQRLAGVAIYALLCERLLDRRPARVQLLHLAEPVAIVSTPTERSIRGVEKKLAAVWAAVERACERDDFRPNPSRLCDWCAFQAYCPAKGGDLSLVAAVSQAQAPAQTAAQALASA